MSGVGLRAQDLEGQGVAGFVFSRVTCVRACLVICSAWGCVLARVHGVFVFRVGRHHARPRTRPDVCSQCDALVGVCLWCLRARRGSASLLPDFFLRASRGQHGSIVESGRATC